MKVSALEFRLRYLIHALIYLIGFTAPWNYWLHLDSIRTWQILAALPARSGLISFSAATIAVLILAIVFALIGAMLRTWGAAYLGATTVQAVAMYGDDIVAAGPYRHIRNPLYLGTFLHTFALALLMPPSGALFCLMAVGFFQLRLIGAEEFFLTSKLGAPYVAYCSKVPRLLPAITPRVPPTATQPAWPTAFISEIYMWGVVFSFAVLGWRYNAILIIKGVLIFLGGSMIVRAFIPESKH
jgi:protein-S-isoprenylcysteine O-methyltransferase Ste14